MSARSACDGGDAKKAISPKHRKIFRNRSGFRAAEIAIRSGRHKSAETPVCLAASKIFSLPRPLKRGHKSGHGDNMIAALHHNKSLRRRLVAGSIVALACGAATVWHGATSEASNVAPATPETKLVKAVSVSPAPAVDNRVAVGEIKPRLESDLGFRISGKLIQRSAEVGATVKKGEILARIDDQDYRNRLASAEADVAAAQAVLVEASAAEARISALLAKGFTTRANHDATLKNLRSAEAKLKSANIAFAMAKDQLSYTELRAEFDGIVTATGAEAGQSVNVGQMVVRLADPSNRDAVFSIAEAAFASERGGREIPAVTVSLLS
ncbi:efflux RND transporter periplasmic adaptor subunit, partial [Mesorhizobium sp.]|uniref:efflux RND transporter periplasmic adaptor subunit n=1 Tax=Mesorhizobium sp. TaxID=1871066 RepID=UPI0025EAE61E